MPFWSYHSTCLPLSHTNLSDFSFGGYYPAVNDRSDQQLLKDYDESHSEEAFGILVRRHVNFVYSAALRLVRDSHLAKDVTQGVFIALAQNADKLIQHPVLSGWLHRTAQNIAANVIRAEVRRRAREEEAVAMNQTPSAEEDVPWEQVAPHLDEVLGHLSDSDRDALLLRYYERKSASEMGQALGISDEAAQKRVNRAVERLRDLFSKRGLTVGSTALVALISGSAVQSAPAGLSATISNGAILSALAAQSANATLPNVIVMSTLKKTIIATLVVAAIAIPIAMQYQAKEKQGEGNPSQRLPAQEQNRPRTEDRPLTKRLVPVVSRESNSPAEVSEIQPAPQERLSTVRPIVVEEIANVLVLPPEIRSDSAAEITGKVVLQGTLPPEKPLDVLKNDVNCGKLVNEAPQTRFFVVSTNGELADVVVHLKGVMGKSAGETQEPLLLDQLNCEYVPYIAAAQTRQKILVRNSDPVFHNVHPTPALGTRNKETNKAQMGKGRDLEFAFEDPEMFLRYKCDVHPWMYSYVSVFDHPYFAVTDTKGNFTIKNVPPGKYTIEASHRKGGTVTRDIEVKGSNVAADFVVEVK